MVVKPSLFAEMANEFVEQNGLDDPRAQFEVFEEEVEELEDAMDGNGVIQEEMADVVITVFVLAEIMEVDLTGEYMDKMEYNLRKSGEKDENGKVIDDV